MNPMTNAQIEAAKTANMKAAERGQAAQVSQSKMLLRSHELVWSRDGAEIRDAASNGKVIFSGTRTEAIAEAKRRNLWC